MGTLEEIQEADRETQKCVSDARLAMNLAAGNPTDYSQRDAVAKLYYAINAIEAEQAVLRRVKDKLRSMHDDAKMVLDLRERRGQAGEIPNPHPFGRDRRPVPVMTPIPGPLVIEPHPHGGMQVIGCASCEAERRRLSESGAYGRTTPPSPPRDDDERRAEWRRKNGLA